MIRRGICSCAPGQLVLCFTAWVCHVQDHKNLEMLWPKGTCAELGLAGCVNITLSTALQAIVNASNTPAVAALLNKRIQDMSQTMSAGSGTAMAQVCIQVYLHNWCMRGASVGDVSCQKGAGRSNL